MQTHRIHLMFTTEKNLKLFDQYHDQWLEEGTFDIAPTLFKQEDIIHIRVNGKSFPMVYGFLPNKKQRTYKKNL